MRSSEVTYQMNTFHIQGKTKATPLGVSAFIPQIVLNSPPSVKMYGIWCNLNLQDFHIQQYIKPERIKLHAQSKYAGLIKLSLEAGGEKQQQQQEKLKFKLPLIFKS